MGVGVSVRRESDMPLNALKYFLMLIQQRVLPKTLKNNFIFTKKKYDWDSEMKNCCVCVF